LPLSPPQVTSDPLETHLLFSPPPSRVGSPQRSPSASMNPPGSHAASPPTLSSPPARQTRKLHVASPFPSTTADSSYRSRLLPARAASRPGAPPQRSATDESVSRSASPQSRTRSSTPAERHAARCAALDKVEAIVARSWSVRDMNGSPPPSSPTLFGAISSGPREDLTWAVGIEQRLTTMDDGRK